MKRTLLILLIFAATLFSGKQIAWAQTSDDIMGAGGDLYPDRNCAPVEATFEVRFYSTKQFDLSRLEIRIDWKDGDLNTYTSTSTPDFVQEKIGSGSEPAYTYYVNTAHTYQENGDQCEYNPTGKLYIDGKEVSEEVTRNLVVWDKDNANSGKIVAVPEHYRACPGQEFTVFFNDKSIWNCTPASGETDKMNKFSRWTRFTYGTVEGNAAADRINNVKVDGAVRTYPYKGAVKGHLYTGSNEILFPDHQSLSVTVPDNAQVGEIFEIKLENWNMCNPYDPADESNAIFTYAYIEIVAPPVPQISAPTEVCPDEGVKFTGSETSGLTSLEYNWEVYDDLAGTTLSDGGTSSSKVFDFKGFATAGKKLVKLKIKRKNTELTCWAEKTFEIDVIDAPTVDRYINGIDTEELSLCNDPANPPSVTYKFELNSSNTYKYELGVFDKNSTQTTPETIQENGTVAGGSKEVAYAVDYSLAGAGPGSYRVRMLVIDQLTGCETEKVAVTHVFDQPVADFSFENLCAGQSTVFKDASTLPTAVNGDKIVSWDWDFDNDGTVDKSATTNNDVTHSYAAGIYEVGLTVKTQAGCSHKVEKDIEVYAVPKAELAFDDYTGPICPGPVTFINKSFDFNNTNFPDADNQVSYKLIYTDGTNEEEVDFLTKTRDLTFGNSTGSLLTYSVQLKAVAAKSGCEALSDPLTVEVMPGAAAHFYEPDYSLFDDNCSPVDLEFIVDQPTLNLAGDDHTWVIYKDGVEVYKNTFTKPSDPAVENEYHKLPYQANASPSDKGVYEVHLLVNVPGQCVQPAINKYKINPRPVPEVLDPVVTQDCEFTYIEVKVNEMAGVKKLHWNISPVPYNLHEITYDDEFTLVYERPAKNAPAYQVELSLEKENFFGCRQNPASEKEIDIIPIIIETVEVQLESPDDAGCSPFTAEFKNTTNAPAGTDFELYVKYGIEEEQMLDLNDPKFEGNGDGLLNDFAYTFEKPGSYIVRLKAIGPDGCTLYSNGSLNLTVHDYPAPNFDLTEKEGCGPLTASFIKNIQNSVDNHWTITDLSDHSVLLNTNVDADVSTFDFINTGDVLKEYEVKLMATSANGCSKDSVITVKVYPEAEVDFDLAEDRLCVPFEVNVTNISSGNPTGTTYSWSWDDGTSTASNDGALSHVYYNPSYSATLYKNITLTATTPDGCSISTAKTVEILPRVQAAMAPSNTLTCAPLTLYLQNNSLGADTYSWEIREKGTSAAAVYTSSESLPNDIPDLLNDGSTDKIYEVVLVASNSSTGCADTETMEITVKPGAKSEFAMDVTSAICSETEVLFTNLNVQPENKYIWNWGDGEPNDTTTSQLSLNHSFLNTSTTRDKQFEVSLTAVNTLSGCTHISKQRIRVSPTVKVNVQPDKTEGCAPFEVNFRNASENVTTHEWFVRLAGTQKEEQQQDMAEGYFMLDNFTADVLNYEVVYIGTSPTGCADTAVHTIKVHPELAPSFSTDSIRVRLPNSTFKIFNESPHAESWTYHWDFGDGTSSDEVDPGSHTYASYGKYTVTLTVSNEVCSKSVEQDVIVNEILPIVDFESIPVEGCWPLVVEFKNNSKYADPNTYYWDFGDGEGYATSENPTYTYYKPGEYTVTLSASNPSGEVISTSYAIVTVFGRPRIDFELRDEVVYVPDDPLYVANHTRGATSYLWDFGDGTTYTEAEPVHEYQEPGVYTITLIAQNEWGCADTLTKEGVVTAIAGGKAKIPNAFTPNSSGSVGGDVSAGNNDVFFPLLDGGVNQYNLKIYNRWGELLFESNRREVGWDGYYKGRLCKSDVYVYKLSVEFSDGKTMEKLGDVTLIR